jgi:capsular exopolysaccharide synthesis family protein
MLHRIEIAAAQGKNDPSYKRLERDIATYQKNLDSAAVSSRPQITEQLKSMAALEEQDLLNQLQAELELKTTLEDLLAERYREQVAIAGESGDQLMDLEFTRAELAREEKVFEMIAERSMALTTESRAPGRVALLRRAETPAGPVESLPLRNLAAAIFASGCLPFGLALLWELSVRRIGDVDQLSQHSSLPVVGEVAKLPMKIRSLTPGGSRALSLFEESIDSLRVGLVLPDQNQDVQVLAVTSAVHSEGKSSISSQLAVSIGRSIGEPVLLIDGDLRVPDVHHIFEVSNDLGFAAVLDGRATLEEAIITSWSDTVHLLPAGRLKKSPHKLMSVEILRKMLDELRGDYRYIIIDTPPILSASESLMLAKVADGTVLSTRRNVSRESQVRIAYERLMKAGARPMGAVFNGVPTRSYASTYGSYDYARSFE